MRQGTQTKSVSPKKKKSFWKRKDFEYGFILQDDLYSKMKRQHAGESTVILHQLMKNQRPPGFLQEGAV